jgi:hypothetical protein
MRRKKKLSLLVLVAHRMALTGWCCRWPWRWWCLVCSVALTLACSGGHVLQRRQMCAFGFAPSFRLGVYTHSLTCLLHITCMMPTVCLQCLH